MVVAVCLAAPAAAVACASEAPGDGAPGAEVQGDAGDTPRAPPRAAGAEPATLRAVRAPLVVDLGEVTPFEEVSVEVPPGAVGMNLVVQSEDPGSLVGVLRVTSPTGERVHERYAPKGGSQATGLAARGGIAAAEIPQGEAASFRPLVPGTWRLVFGDGRELLADGRAPPVAVRGAPRTFARAVIQLGARVPDGFGARLDLVVHVPDGLRLGARTIDATSAAGDESVAERLAVFFEGFARLFDVGRGEVRFVPAPAAMRVLVDTDIEEAFAVSRGMPDEQALHVVLTNVIAVGMGATAWGVSPGVPGAAALSGTPLSAVVLAVGDTPPDVDGLVLLHETGHFLGLSHTSELDGRAADPLDDTERCPALSGADPESAERCPDRFNLMFPTLTDGWADNLRVSGAQRDVVRGSPVLRAYAESHPATRRPATLLRSRRGSRGVVPAGRPLCPGARAR